MSQDTSVQKLVRDYLEQGKYVGMICAGTPYRLIENDLFGLMFCLAHPGSLAAKTSQLPSQPLTSHPSVKAQLEASFEYSEQPVVVSGKLITRLVVLTASFLTGFSF